MRGAYALWRFRRVREDGCRPGYHKTCRNLMKEWGSEWETSRRSGIGSGIGRRVSEWGSEGVSGRSRRGRGRVSRHSWRS